ncbi:protein-L-isoaspartate(D-aspartate) O-methyltransferase [Thiohalocapsa marina]|uniref:protein-L-isoaspartate(D-aspartate) O-methyltransferase n=1 Tax=Thiohalocapsa marina TaxID=424902 RepID=UPI0036DD51C2
MPGVGDSGAVGGADPRNATGTADGGDDGVGRARDGAGPAWQRPRQQLVRRLRAAGIRDERVLQALGLLPRHLFVDEALASHAYDDTALPIGHGQTLSQPYTVARMTEVLLAAGDCATVLEIGTGSAFQTAVLASLVRRVYSIERIAALWQRAEARLRDLRLRNVRLRHSDGHLGWPEYAPFDGILMTAAANGVPRLLAEQLAPGGRMVLPLDRGEGQVLLRLTRTRAGFRHEVLEPVTFVPLLGGIA